MSPGYAGRAEQADGTPVLVQLLGRGGVEWYSVVEVIGVDGLKLIRRGLRSCRKSVLERPQKSDASQGEKNNFFFLPS